MAKKIITWATPKKLQKSREDTRWHSKRKKPCKVTKGEHEFTEISKENRSGWVEVRCKCGKKDWKEMAKRSFNINI